MLWLHVQGYPAEFTVDVESTLQLQEVPILHDHLYSCVLRFALLYGVVHEYDFHEFHGYIVFGPTIFQISNIVNNRF